MRSSFSAISLSIAAAASVAFVAVSAPPVKKVGVPKSEVTYKQVRAFVDKYCVSCHGANGATGGINLSKYLSVDAMLNDRATWDKVIGTIEIGRAHV